MVESCWGGGAARRVQMTVDSVELATAGDVVAGEESKKSVRISNNSTRAADFQLLSEQDGVFKFERVEGIVPAELYPGKAGHVDLVRAPPL